MIIDCISDLHGHHPQLEGGDLLVIAGDLTARDTKDEYLVLFEKLVVLSYKKIIFICGNHDNWGQNHLLYYNYGNIEYLCDSGTEFQGLKIWGSPWTKTFEGMNPHCKAFTVDIDEELAEKWALIPEDIDILITHSPAYGMRDGINSEQRLGSTSLLRRLVSTSLYKKLKLHVCGHIHEGYGTFDIRESQKQYGDEETCVYVNASHVNERYEPVNKPIRILL